MRLATVMMTSDIYEAHADVCYYAKGFTKIVSFNRHNSHMG